MLKIATNSLIKRIESEDMPIRYLFSVHDEIVITAKHEVMDYASQMLKEVMIDAAIKLLGIDFIKVDDNVNTNWIKL